MFARGPRVSWVDFGDFQLGNFAIIAAGHFKVEVVDGDGFAELWQPPKGVQHKAADGVEFVIGETHIKKLIEVTDLGDGFYGERAAFGRQYGGFFVVIGFVFDFTNNFLENIFNGDQPLHAAVFIDHDGHVVAFFAELLQ